MYLLIDDVNFIEVLNDSRYYYSVPLDLYNIWSNTFRVDDDG